MAVKDIDFLRSELPDVFEDRPMPPGWDDNWLIVPIQNAEAAYVERGNDDEHLVEEALFANQVEVARRIQEQVVTPSH